MHLISHAEATRLGSEIRRSKTTIKLSTAKGITESNTEALVKLPNFTEPLVHQILEETPHALSIGRLVEEEDCRQIWNRIDGFKIVDKDGNLIPTSVRNYVPFFTDAVDLAFSALPANNPIPLPENSEQELPEVEPEIAEQLEEIPTVPIEIPTVPIHNTIARLRNEAKTVQHLLTHLPFNSECSCCVEARTKKSYATRTTPADRALQHPEAKCFSDVVSGDHAITSNDFAKGLNGETVALLLIDWSTSFRDVYPAVAKSASEVVKAFQHFLGSE